MKRSIIPSVIATSQEELEVRFAKFEKSATALHLDFMDGTFVPNKSLDFEFTLPKTSCKLDAHLMLQDPEEWIERHAAKVDTVIFHLESDASPDAAIALVKRQGKKVGIAINPATPIDELEEYLPLIDRVLIMSVIPGQYGAPFVPAAVAKIAALRKMSPDIDIEVDGSINPETIGDVAAAGANLFVSGSYLLNAENVGLAIKKLEACFDN